MFSFARTTRPLAAWAFSISPPQHTESFFKSNCGRVVGLFSPSKRRAKTLLSLASNSTNFHTKGNLCEDSTSDEPYELELEISTPQDMEDLGAVISVGTNGGDVSKQFIYFFGTPFVSVM